MSEEFEAKLDGARLQPNSGRGQHSKGDATMSFGGQRYVVDYKEYSKGYRLTPENWSKLTTDAWRVDEDSEGLLKLVLGDQPLRLAVLQWSHLLDVFNTIDRLRREVGFLQEELADARAIEFKDECFGTD